MCFYYFEGCDTTSSFYGKGQLSVWKVAKMNEGYRSTFANLGSETNPSEELKKQLQNFVCHLYGYEGYSEINSIRFEIVKSGKYDEELLPPNQNSLDQHIRRANFQCFIWRHATQATLNLPSFCSHGWKLDEEGNVVIDWMTIPAAPDCILEFVNCKCKKGCDSRRCSCVKASLKCSDLCACEDCRNRSEEEQDSIDSESDSYNCCSDSSSSDSDEE